MNWLLPTVNGSTGEGPSLTTEERMKTTECWVKAGRRNNRYVTHSDLQSHRHTQTETQTVRHTSDRHTDTNTRVRGISETTRHLQTSNPSNRRSRLNCLYRIERHGGKKELFHTCTKRSFLSFLTVIRVTVTDWGDDWHYIIIMMIALTRRRWLDRDNKWHFLLMVTGIIAGHREKSPVL